MTWVIGVKRGVVNGKRRFLTFAKPTVFEVRQYRLQRSNCSRRSIYINRSCSDSGLYFNYSGSSQGATRLSLFPRAFISLTDGIHHQQSQQNLCVITHTQSGQFYVRQQTIKTAFFSTTHVEHSAIQAIGYYLKYLNVLCDSSGTFLFREPNKVLSAQQTNSVKLDDV